MNRYIVKGNFRANAQLEIRVMKKGEVLRLSSIKAAKLVAQGLIVEEHVGLDLLDSYESRVQVLIEKLKYSRDDAQTDATEMVKSYLKRHESLKRFATPSEEFLTEVEEFNRTSTGKNPVHKEQSETGVGEWAGYTCNIGQGCLHGCLYCYAEKMAVRFNRVANSEAWKEEGLREASTKGCKKYNSPIMFPTTHDITPTYLPAYRVHLYNILEAGNKVLIVSKPHRESIEAICKEFSSYRDNMIFRFTIGGLDADVMRHWEPEAPLFEERLHCLKHAFEQGYTTSVSAEPMLGGREEAQKLYYLLEPYVTWEFWFGVMNYIGGLRNSIDPEVARHAMELTALQTDDEIMELVGSLDGLPKVKWKDSVTEIIAKRAG